jgi:hypothetical protein
MANVEFCEHDWPGSGCAECRSARESAQLECVEVASGESLAVEPTPEVSD